MARLYNARRRFHPCGAPRIGGAALWGAYLIHAAIGALFVYALARDRG
jgi:hypothetical protein